MVDIVTWTTVVILAIQIASSWLLKRYTSTNPKAIPLINFGTAFAYYTIYEVSQGLSWGQALLQGLYMGLLTMVTTTGVFAATRSTVRLFNGTANESPVIPTK